MLKIHLTGPNASYLARRWFEQGKVDWSDGTDLVQLHEQPSVPGAEAPVVPASAMAGAV